jgi:hypothetical protein
MGARPVRQWAATAMTPMLLITWDGYFPANPQRSSVVAALGPTRAYRAQSTAHLGSPRLQIPAVVISVPSPHVVAVCLGGFTRLPDPAGLAGRLRPSSSCRRCSRRLLGLRGGLIRIWALRQSGKRSAGRSTTACATRSKPTSLSCSPRGRSGAGSSTRRAGPSARSSNSPTLPHCADPGRRPPHHRRRPATRRPPRRPEQDQQRPALARTRMTMDVPD